MLHEEEEEFMFDIVLVLFEVIFNESSNALYFR